METETIVIVALVQSCIIVVLIFVCISLVKKLYKTKVDAYRSSVSGLPNRLGIEGQVKGVFAQLHRGKVEKITVVYIDLDYFKPVNDEYGHKYGDKVLKVIGQILLRSTRPEDIVAHFTGDEYVIIFTDTEDSQIEKILARAKEKFSDHEFSFTKGKKLQTNITYGIASSARGDESFDSLLHSADLDCNRRKKLAGGSRFKPAQA